MVERFREFLQTSGGRAAGIAVAILALIGAVMSVRTNLGPSEAASLSRERVYVCAETGKPFDVTLVVGMKTPVDSPHSGKQTGYPAELCFWTKAGSIQKNPTAVLLNATVGKSGPTFCPDCGRLVTAFNAAPQPGAKAPPTQAEYKSE